MSWQELPLDRIYFDSVTGVPGTTWPIGTPTVPSDVIADVILMCAARNFHTIQVHGALTLGAAMEHYNFVGYEHEDVTDILDLSGEDVDGSHISGMIVTGGQGGDAFLTLVRCLVNAVTLFSGRMNWCSFWGGVTSSFKNAGYIDLIDCESIYGVVTLTVQAPARASIKNWRGNLTLTAQTGGVLFIRGYKGTLVIDAMTGGTCDIYANGADITINANCDAPSVISIYGNARVTVVGAPTATIHDYTKETQLDGIEASVGRSLLSMDFWSALKEEIVVTGAQTTPIPPPVVVEDLPGDAVIVRAIVMMKFRMVENDYAGENKLDAAAVLPMQVDDGVTGMLTCIDFVDEAFTLAEATREGGDVTVGDIDVAARVDGNDTYNFQWLNAKALANNLRFNDVQMGIRIWYSI